MSIAIIAALPREIAGLVKGTDAEPSLRARGIFLYRIKDAVIVAAGMGSMRASLAVEAALQTSDVSTLVSVGLAGACQTSVLAGSVITAGKVVDVRTGERFATVDVEQPFLLATVGEIASAREKARLAEAYGAAMVDMEAATVARLARAHGLAFRAVKAISDASSFEMESLGRFATHDGQFRTAAFALHTALRPSQWRLAMELGRNSSVALQELTKYLRFVIDQA